MAQRKRTAICDLLTSFSDENASFAVELWKFS
jgi:hypothetical protein